MRHAVPGLLRPLRGPAGWALVALALAGYLCLALAPFRWVPPRRLVNGAAADARGLRFARAGLASTPQPPAWLAQVAQTGSLRLHLRLRAYTPDPVEHGRIFTISRDYHFRNLTLDQDGEDLVLRLRRPGATPNGKPAYRLPAVLHDTGWHDVHIAISPGQLQVTIDGHLALADPLAPRPLQDWDRGHRLALGNEHHGYLPWLGEVAQAVVEVGGSRVDYARPGAVELPSHFWQFGNRPIWLLEDFTYPASVKDWAGNFMIFVPLGFLLAMLGRPPGAGRRALWLCVALSLAVEVAQAFFARHPAMLDWVFNSLGAAVGAAAAGHAARSGPR